MIAELLRIGWLLATVLGCGLLYRGWCGWLALRREQLADQGARKALSARDDDLEQQIQNVRAIAVERIEAMRAELTGHVAKLERADQGLFERNESQVKNLMAEVHEVVAAFETKQATALTSLADGGRGRLRLPTTRTG